MFVNSFIVNLLLHVLCWILVLKNKLYIKQAKTSLKIYLNVQKIINAILKNIIKVWKKKHKYELTKTRVWNRFLDPLELTTKEQPRRHRGGTVQSFLALLIKLFFCYFKININIGMRYWMTISWLKIYPLLY